MKNTFKFLVGTVAAIALTLVVASTASAAYTHTGLLKMGMTSSQVMSLQQTLNGGGFLISTTGAGSPGMETAYFGAKTKAAVMAFQSAKGLSVDGAVGAQTGTALAAMVGGNVSFPAGCSSASGYSTTTGAACNSGNANTFPAGCSSAAGYSSTTGAKCDSTTGTPSDLSGTDGSISLVTELTQYASEEVGEGSEDVKVLGMDVEASNDGDIAIRSIKVSFDPTGNTGSDNLDDYIDSVSVWMGSTKVGSADADDFSQDSNDLWTRTITLSNAVVEADETEQFYISVDAVGNLDSGDISGDSWTVDVENIRYEDGAGVVTTDTDGEINGMDVPIAFVSFSAASDTEFKISSHEDNPEAGIVVASNTGTTDDVVLLKGEIEIEGESDVVIKDLPITFSPTSSNMNVIVSSIKLVIDGKEYSESVPSIAAAASASITFDNLDLTIDAGDTVTFEVIAEIADTDDFTAGATVTASLTSTNRAAMDVENEQGDNLTAGERSGTASGEALEFRANGIAVTFVSATEAKSASDTDNGDTGTFTIKYKLTAIGDDVYVSTTVSTSGAKNNLYAVDISGTASTTDSSAVLVNNTDSTVTSGLYLIQEGESETFTLTVLRNGSSTDGLYRAALTSIKWDDEAGDTTPDNNYTTNLDDFKTDYLSLD